MTATLRRCSEVPAVVALAIFLALGVGLVAADLRASPLTVVLLLAWGAYCIARPTVGWGLFLLPAGVSVVAQIADAISDGAYWWVYGGLVPIALLAARADDQAPEAR